MAWPAWPDGALPLDTTGFPQAAWKHGLPQFHRKVELALPCVGLDALGVGLQAFDWNHFEIAYACDVDSKLLPALLATHGPTGLRVRVWHWVLLVGICSSWMFNHGR